MITREYSTPAANGFTTNASGTDDSKAIFVRCHGNSSGRTLTMGQLLKLPLMVPGDLEAQGDGGYSKCSRVLFRQLWVSFWVPFAHDSGPSRQQRPDKQSTSRSSLEIVVIFSERRTDRKPGLLVGDLWPDDAGSLPRAIVSAGGRPTTLGSCWCLAPRQRL